MAGYTEADLELARAVLGDLQRCQVSEPSKEALGRVFSLGIFNENEMDLLERVATALQELMDDRDDTQKAASDNWDEAIREGHARIQAVKRAEAAEAKLAVLVHRVLEWIGPNRSFPALSDILADFEPKTEEPGR